MAGAQGAGPLDRLLTGIAAITVLDNGTALADLVDKLNIIGASITYTAPGVGEEYGTATITVNVGAAPGWSIEGGGDVHPTRIAIGSLIASYNEEAGILTIEIPLATDSTAGLMSSSDKAKLDSISETTGGANQVYCSNGTTNSWSGSPIISNLFFAATATTPTIQQNDTATGNGKNLLIAAQSSTAATSTGGNVIIDAGAGTATDGSVVIRSPNATYCTFSPTTFTCALEYASNILFTPTRTTPTIQQQSTNSGNGQNMILCAQSSTDTASTGGTLYVSAGLGTSLNGSVVVGAPGTPYCTFSPTTFTCALEYASNILFTPTRSTPTIQQQNTSTGNGQNMIVSAQSSTDAGSTGGTLYLDGGLGTSANGSVVVGAPGIPYAKFNTDAAALCVDSLTNVRTNASGYRIVDCTFWFAVPLSYGSDSTVVIQGSKWGAIGALNASVTTAHCYVQVETEHNTSGGSSVHQEFRGHLLANRGTSSNWSVNYDLTENTAEKDPSAAGASMTVSMAVGGTQNGDVTITVHPLNSNANQSVAMLCVRMRGAWRV